jgi:AAA ATPase domain
LNPPNIWDFRLTVKKRDSRSKESSKWKEYKRPTDKNQEDLWLQIANGAEQRLPRIAYFPTFLVDLPHRIYLKEHKDEKPVNRYYRYVFQDVLDSLDNGLDLTRHVCNRIEQFRASEESVNWMSLFFGSTEKTTIDLVFQQISHAVTKEVLGSWEKVFQLPISAKNVLIDWAVDTEKGGIPYASFKVSDGASQYAISERSLGFRWFFSFLLFTAFKKASERQTIFVFDEPAANLHAKAQAELLKSFSRIVDDGNRVVYSTHSHHMIEPTWLSGSYIVENTAIDHDSGDNFGLTTKPTNVNATNYRKFVSQNESRISYFQPVLEKLQYVAPQIVGSPPFVIVEGITDYQVMRLVQRLRYPQALFALLPGTGAGASGSLISLLLGRGEKFVVLLDDDVEGRKEALRYKNEWHLSNDTVVTLKDLIPDFPNKKLESMICSESREIAKTHAGTPTLPTKKQLGWYFAEMCAVQCDESCIGRETLKHVSAVLDALTMKLK